MIAVVVHGEGLDFLVAHGWLWRIVLSADRDRILDLRHEDILSSSHDLGLSEAAPSSLLVVLVLKLLVVFGVSFLRRAYDH